MDSNRRRELLSAGIDVGDFEVGGGDADTAEYRRQIDALLDDLDAIAGMSSMGEDELLEVYEELEEGEEVDDDDLLLGESRPAGEVDNLPHQPNEIVRFCIRMSFNALTYPYEFVRILIQLGHEPMPSQSYKLWIFKPRLFLPGVLKYVEYIKRYDGFAGLYRGLGARLIGSAIGFIASNCVIRLLGMRHSNQRGPKEQPLQFGEFAWNLFRDGIRLATASALSYPFHVVMVRQAAQFIGQERVFNDLRRSFLEIYQAHGILGFYPGFAPKILGEMGVLVITSTVGYIFTRCLSMSRARRQYNLVVVQMVATMAMYPLEVASTCMICRGAPLAAGAPPFMPPYGNWFDCLTDLYARGEHNRGALLFWRTVPRYQIQTSVIDGAPHVRLA